MSENTTASQKRVLFNEDINVSTGVVYPKSPIPRSTRTQKTTTHIPPSSSGQGSSKFRHKSPTGRHVSPHRSLSKNKVMFNWEDVDNSVRKTQSTALPAVINAPWSRSTTVSTPDLKVEDHGVATEDNIRNENADHRSKFYHASHLIFILLNCIVLATGLLHFAAALIMTIYKEQLLIMVENWSYVTYVITLYIDVIVQIVLPITGLVTIPHKSWKTYAACSLHLGILTLALGKFQSRIQSSIQNNLSARMMASIRTQPDFPESTKTAWNYIQKMFKCCGVHGRLDWCRKIELFDMANSANFLGSYVCHLPASCCIDNIDDIISSKISNRYPENSIIPCLISPTPLNTYPNGCLGQVKREMQYVGMLLQIVNYSPGIVLFLATGIAATLAFTVN